MEYPSLITKINNTITIPNSKVSISEKANMQQAVLLPDSNFFLVALGFGDTMGVQPKNIF